MLKYFISIYFLMFSFAASAQEDMEDDEPSKPVIKADSFHQLRFEADVFKPIMFSRSADRKEYGFNVDYYWKKELYFVLEGGAGNARLQYSDLQYNTRNTFFKAGINKGILNRLSTRDWDMAFIGLRYAMAPINRGAGTYAVVDSFFGSTNGVIAPQNITAHWVEVTGGVRVELIKGFFAGWNVRGKFRLNGKKFTELPPVYIAGYGKGDKNSVFDFNFYIAYAIRWKKHF